MPLHASLAKGGATRHLLRSPAGTCLLLALGLAQLVLQVLLVAVADVVEYAESQLVMIAILLAACVGLYLVADQGGLPRVNFLDAEQLHVCLHWWRKTALSPACSPCLLASECLHLFLQLRVLGGLEELGLVGVLNGLQLSEVDLVQGYFALNFHLKELF